MLIKQNDRATCGEAISIQCRNVTDRLTGRILISISRVSVLTRDKMYQLCNNKMWDLLLIPVIIELATSNLVHNFRLAQ